MGNRSGGIGALSLGDIVRAAKRYQPVVLGVAALLVIFAVLPEPERLQGAAGDSRSLLDQTRAAPTGNVTTSPGSSVPAAAPGVSDSAMYDPSFSSPAAAFEPSPSDGFGSETFGSTSGSSSDPVATFDGPSFDSDTTSTGTPLRITASTWATRSAGTPLAGQGVPPDTLPVGTRVTTDDKLSFVRLAGDETQLRLVEEPTGNRNTSGPASVQACQVTMEGWMEGEAVPIDEAPGYDATDCVLGTRNDQGVWTFDLAGFDDPTDDRGFALVPGEGAGVDFQVAFKRS